MADKEPAKQPSGKAPKKGGKGKFVFFLIIAAFAMPFMLPSVVLLLAGLIPTYVAYGTDPDPDKSGAASVGAMNLAGITPFLIDLWMKGQTLDNAFRLLTDANNWFIILGAAAVGQLVIYAIPQAIATLTLTHAEARVRGLRKNLDMLKESWGSDVAAAKFAEKGAQE
jgi:hypothetical protein